MLPPGGTPRGEPSCPSRFLGLPVILGLWLHCYSLCFPGHIASSSSVSGKSPSSFLTRALVMAFWVHLDNPQESLHLKVLDNIHKYTFFFRRWHLLVPAIRTWHFFSLLELIIQNPLSTTLCFSSQIRIIGLIWVHQVSCDTPVTSFLTILPRVQCAPGTSPSLVFSSQGLGPCFLTSQKSLLKCHLHWEAVLYLPPYFFFLLLPHLPLFSSSFHICQASPFPAKSLSLPKGNF